MAKHAVVVLDETGSMQGQEERVVTSMNEYAATLSKKTNLTVFKFDSARWSTFFSGKARDWRKMRKDDYAPGAMTPLYDSIGKAITFAREQAKKGDKVMIVIDTDGYENASTEYNHKKITSMIEKQKGKGWGFLFIANSLTEREATKIGDIGRGLGMQAMASSYGNRSQTYTAAAGNTQAYFDSTSNAVEKKDKKDKAAEPTLSAVR